MPILVFHMSFVILLMFSDPAHTWMQGILHKTFFIHSGHPTLDIAIWLNALNSQRILFGLNTNKC